MQVWRCLAAPSTFTLLLRPCISRSRAYKANSCLSPPDQTDRPALANRALLGCLDFTLIFRASSATVDYVPAAMLPKRMPSHQIRWIVTVLYSERQSLAPFSCSPQACTLLENKWLVSWCSTACDVTVELCAPLMLPAPMHGGSWRAVHAVALHGHSWLQKLLPLERSHQLSPSPLQAAHTITASLSPDLGAGCAKAPTGEAIAGNEFGRLQGAAPPACWSPGLSRPPSLPCHAEVWETATVHLASSRGDSQGCHGVTRRISTPYMCTTPSAWRGKARSRALAGAAGRLVKPKQAVR